MEPKYEIIIFWSEADDAYVADAPELSGGMADGSTHHEALSNAQRVIQEWMERLPRSLATHSSKA